MAKLADGLVQIKKMRPGYMTSKEQHELMNVTELLIYLSDQQKQEISDLKDLVNELKGEQGKPEIAAKNQKEKKVAKNHSSEKERAVKNKERKAKKQKFEGKTPVIEEVEVSSDVSLPNDAVFLTYRDSHYYDFQIKSELIKLRRKVYYSPSTGLYYAADFPSNYPEGKDYTYTLQESAYKLKYKWGMSLQTILDMFQSSGIEITNGTLSNMLLSVGELLSDEREAIHQSGITNGLYTSSDTTLDRYNGANHHAHIFCNQWFTTYYTRATKDRQTIIDLLRCEKERTYLLNNEGLELCRTLGSSKKAVRLLKDKTFEEPKTAVEFAAFLKLHLSTLSEKAFQSCQKRIYEAAYLAAYYQEENLGVFLSDNAPQYNLISLATALCWIHAGRHFKKLNPTITVYQEELKGFLLQFWMYYDWLLAYKKAPTPELRKKLDEDFDALFSIQTNYELLDDRIRKTKALKDKLLAVLEYPDLPLHNNDAELAARRQVRYRDISFQTRSEKGRNAKNIALSIYQTCKKLGVDATQYILDRLTKKNEMISLADLIYQRANCAV
jgi:hypothetical protein